MKTLLAIAYRSLVLSVAEATGRACSWLSGEWRPFVLWFGVVAVAISAVQYLMGNPVWEWRALARGILSGLPVSWWKILLAFILSVVLWLSWQARRRVVVEAFTDNASLGAEVKGLSTLLMVDLAKIRDLYSHVDEQRAIPTEFEVNAPFDTLIKVEDVSDFLQNAVNADYKISIPGGLELPLGALMAIAGRIVKGPRIIGSVYKDGERLIVTAIYTGGRRVRVWRVDDPAPLGEPGGGPRTLDDMVLELAYRMFTDLALNGTVRWMATYYFCDGLREYRNCLRTPVDRNLKLIRAEQCFIKALSDDEKLYHAYHNLGVVYAELGRGEAAQSSFLKAIAYNRMNMGSYYGLAEQQFRNRRFDEAIRHCDHIINTRRRATKAYDYAKAWDLRGIAGRLGDENDAKVLDRAIASHREAVKYAREALYRAALRRKDVERMKVLASYCLWDLAAAHEYRADKDPAHRGKQGYRQAESLLRQALALTTADDGLRGQLGEVYERLGQFGPAADEYARAVQINPSELDHWAGLAFALAGAGDRKQAYDACGHVLDHALELPAKGPGAQKILGKVGEAAEKLGDHRLSDRIARASAGARLSGECHVNRRAAIDCLEWNLRTFEPAARSREYIITALDLSRTYLDEGKADMAERFADLAMERYATLEGPADESARIAVLAGRLFNDLGQYPRAERLYRTAIDRLGRTSPSEIKSQGLERQLARALRKQGKFSESLLHAEKASLQDPLSPENMFESGKIHFELEEYEIARKTCEQALIWDPDNPDIFGKIGDCYMRLAKSAADTPRRNAALGNAIDCFEKALKLYAESDEEKIDVTLFWLAVLYFALGENATSVSKFLLVLSRGFDELNVRLHLGEIYLSSRYYYECEKYLGQLLSAADGLLRNGHPADGLIAARSGEKLYLSEAVAWAHYFLAMARADQGIRLTEALASLETALKYAGSIPDEEIQNHLRASCQGAKGWIYFRQGQIDEAIGQMKDALSIREDIDLLLRLALVYEHKASATDLTDWPDERKQYLARAKACCLRARSLDRYGERLKDVDEMLVRLQFDLDSWSPGETKAL